MTWQTPILAFCMFLGSATASFLEEWKVRIPVSPPFPVVTIPELGLEIQYWEGVTASCPGFGSGDIHAPFESHVKVRRIPHDAPPIHTFTRSCAGRGEDSDHWNYHGRQYVISTPLYELNARIDTLIADTLILIASHPYDAGGEAPLLQAGVALMPPESSTAVPLVMAGDSLEVKAITASCLDGQVTQADWSWGSSGALPGRRRYARGLSIEPELLCNGCLKAGSSMPASFVLEAAGCAGAKDTMRLVFDYRRLHGDRWRGAQDTLTVTGVSRTGASPDSTPQELPAQVARVVHLGYGPLPWLSGSSIYGLDTLTAREALSIEVDESKNGVGGVYLNGTLVSGRRFVLSNHGDSPLPILTIDGSWFFRQEVFYEDEWIPLEEMGSVWCGNSYVPGVLRPGEQVTFAAPRYQGNTVGVLRVAATLGIHGIKAYSHEYKASYDVRQLIRAFSKIEKSGSWEASRLGPDAGESTRDLLGRWIQRTEEMPGPNRTKATNR